MDKFSNADELGKLAALRAAGVLSDKEFQRHKRQLLASTGSRHPAPWMLIIVVVVVVIGGAAAAIGLAPGNTRGKSRDVKIELSASTAETEAVTWAIRHIGDSDWATKCLNFVTEAYTTGAQFPLETDMKYPKSKMNWSTYPEEIWAAGFTTGITKTAQETPNPPFGAIVFFKATTGHSQSTFSHATIMASGGRMISTPDVATRKLVHYETMKQVSTAWNYFVGWWLPDGSTAAPASTPPATAKSSGSTLQVAAPSSSSKSLQGTSTVTLLQPAAKSSSVQSASSGSSTPSTGGGTSSSSSHSTTSATSGHSTTPSHTTTPTHSTTPTHTTSPPTTGSPPATPPAPTTYAETVGGVSHTWTNYTNAGGTEGPSIAAYQTVQISCRLEGFKVADGNTWWYRIAQSPWSTHFYVSADAFYNNGATSGSLIGTPFVDTRVPLC